MEPDENGKKDPQTYAIIGAAMEVHRVLGNGFLEAVYHEAMAIELREKCIPFEPEVSLPIMYKDTTLSCLYKADFVCFGNIIVELKSLRAISDIECAQVLNYLKATGYSRALILNFGTPRLGYQRFVNC